jgi:fumarate hydratase class I
MPDFAYQDLFPLGPDPTGYRHLTSEFVSRASFEGQDILKVAPEALTMLAREAFRDVSFLYRTSHLEKVATILDDPEASPNDRGVALALLRNAAIASEFRLPMCQDTGTATIVAKKGQQVWTGIKDEEWLARGIFETYQKENLRYSQTVPLTMYEEKNSGTNLPAQIDIFAVGGDHYDFLFVAKGGGSANKSLLFQETKALLNPSSLEVFLDQKLRSLGTAACPPYHLAIVIGGTSAEATMKTVKLASAGYLDHLPTEGNAMGRAFRDPALEAKVMDLARKTGIGAQFGGKYFALDARVVRLPRHGASCPVGIGVSCSADRNIKARIDRDGLWIEALERNPARFIPGAAVQATDDGHGIPIDLNRPMADVLIDRDHHRRAGHRPCEDQGTARPRRGDAPLHERLPRLLRRPRQDARRDALGLVRTDHCGAHGRLRRPVPVARRFDDHAREGQSHQGGDGRLQEARRLLPRLHRRPRGAPGARVYQEDGIARVSRARHGGRLQD